MKHMLQGSICPLVLHPKPLIRAMKGVQPSCYKIDTHTLSSAVHMLLA